MAVSRKESGKLSENREGVASFLWGPGEEVSLKTALKMITPFQREKEPALGIWFPIRHGCGIIWFLGH